MGCEEQFCPLLQATLLEDLGLWTNIEGGKSILELKKTWAKQRTPYFFKWHHPCYVWITYWPGQRENKSLSSVVQLKQAATQWGITEAPLYLIMCRSSLPSQTVGTIYWSPLAGAIITGLPCDVPLPNRVAYEILRWGHSAGAEVILLLEKRAMRVTGSAHLEHCRPVSSRLLTTTVLQISMDLAWCILRFKMVKII